MKPTEHEMTVAVDAAARTFYATFADAPPFDELPATERLTIREGVLRLVVAALEAVPDRAEAVISRVESVLEDHESIEDFALTDPDYAALRTCSCAHCEVGDGICPMTVEQLVGDHLRDLRDRVDEVMRDDR